MVRSRLTVYIIIITRELAGFQCGLQPMQIMLKFSVMKLDVDGVDLIASFSQFMGCSCYKMFNLATKKNDFSD